MWDLADYALPPLYALFIWWFSTGLILWLTRLPERARPALLAGATAGLALALVGVASSAGDTSTVGGYHAFTYALAVWAWHELTFLLGMITGPRKLAQSPNASGARRFREAAASIAYHELAFALTAALIVALTWDAPNQIATWTFVALWVLRLSAKLNVFLGVPHFGDELLPVRLLHLKSYFATRAINPLFPVSVTAITATSALMLDHAWRIDATGFEVTGFEVTGFEVTGFEVAGFEVAGYACLGALVALAELEYWFMVLPVRDAALWQWAANRGRSTAAGGNDDDTARFETRPAPAAGPG